MSEMQRKPKPGEFYRDTNHKLYQVIAVARHWETMEEMVVYQALYGEYGVWVRPLSAFMELAAGNADVMGPGLERVLLSEKESGEKTPGADAPEPQPAMHLLDFFDAMDSRHYDKMLECLAKMADRITKKELDDIYLVLDLPPAPADEETQSRLAFLRRHILTLKKFDGERLR